MSQCLSPGAVRVTWDFPRAGQVAGVHEVGTRDFGWSDRPSQILIATVPSEVIGVLQKAHQASVQGDWVIGWVSYDAAEVFDPAYGVPGSCGATPPFDGQQHIPLAFFVVIRPCEVSTAPLSPEPFKLSEPWGDVSRPQAHQAAMQTIQQDIAAGRFYQINYTTRMQASGRGDVHALYRQLAQWQGQGYCALIECDDWAVISMSPELFFDWDGTHLLTAPMKGTARPQGQPERDRQRLKDSAKDQAENVMIVDLLRNDMSRVAQPGSVHVSSLFDVQSLPTVLQMSSTLRCTTRPGIGLVDLFGALFPCGSVTGAPKVEAMRAIRELEPQPRGVYCGAVGVLRPGGHTTFNVAIRTLLIDKHHSQLTYGVGSGITWYSDTQAELAEWANKVHLLHRADAPFDVIETLRFESGHWTRADLHRQRMACAADHFGFPWSDGAWQETLAKIASDLLSQDAQAVWRVRVALNRQGWLSHTQALMPTEPTSVILQLADLPMAAASDYLRFKTSYRAHYDAFAPHSSGVFDTVLWVQTDHGPVLTETTRCNLVLEVNGQLLTPQLNDCFLPGVLRQELVQSGQVAQATIPVTALAQATRIWCINSLRGWLAVSKLIDSKGKPL